MNKSEDFYKIKKASDELIKMLDNPNSLTKSGVRLINQSLSLLQMVTLDSGSWRHDKK